ncbi:helix-turn-helix domain-containing protein [Chitinilyticum litopenaei]|uniref:helix-turn-helix domain-containing protein n=1 Tax=Chitinilyticum litopenaei TaxID=1121276 RepID=UPI00048FA3D4|nr:helix-turn-helix transcriptional regulator [Chitinilyticum litopenaei]
MDAMRRTEDHSAMSVQPNEDTLQRLHWQVEALQHFLACRNLFIITFFGSGEILAHNYPAQEQATRLDDFGFLIGADNLQAIKALSRTTVTGSEGWKFFNRDLQLHLFRVNDTLWNLEVGQQDDDQESQPGHGDFETFYSLTSTLSDMREWQGGGEMDELLARIRDEHLPKIRQVKAAISDPILGMCLELIEGMVVSTLSNDADIDPSLYALLTPSEVQVAKFIKLGMSTKEIATSLSVASKTVENHRNNLRAKLGITNKGINLRNYLIALGNPQG